MSDRYQKIAASPLGKKLFRALGLPVPVTLARQKGATADFISGRVLVGAAEGGYALNDVLAVLAESQADICCHAVDTQASRLIAAGEKVGRKVTQVNTAQGDNTRFQGLVFDATGISSTEELRALHTFFKPVVRRMMPSGRIVILGRPAQSCAGISEAAAMTALEGFTRSLAKEIGKKGTTVQLITVADKAQSHLASPLRFTLSPRSAYVTGQVLAVRDGWAVPDMEWSQPLAGKTVLVTGASRGIGLSIAEVMARDGAKVVCLDIPQASADLQKVATRLGGTALAIDITAPNAPRDIADALEKEHGGVDVVVHNAGITRDKTLGNMKPELWDSVLNINLIAAECINEELLNRELIRENGRIVCVSSVSGLAGNFGQTNYATSKAGVAGYVKAMSDPLREKNITINAVAPGFIETKMTAAIPVMTRVIGRRVNSLVQGGLPVDVAETIGFFASPASTGVTGQVLRVCGQSLIGA